MLTVQVTGLDALRAQFASAAKQVPFAAARALNNAAFGINAKIKTEMQGTFQGGATAYTLRAFSVTKASKSSLQATVMLRTDAQGGTPHAQTLAHLFTGGTRQWKKLEGLIRATGAMPAGTIAVPGRGIKLDARGNINRAQLREVLGSLRTGMQVVRNSGKTQKSTGYFTLPKQQGRLLPGIYKRTTTGGWVSRGKASSGITPMVVFVPMGRWRQFISLDSIAQQQLRTFKADFQTELTKALASAK